MSLENETASTIVLKLRARLADMLKTGLVAPEHFGLYQQTMLQLLGEIERREQECRNQAQQLRQQAAAADSQAHAFIAMKSILFNVVNGYLDLEERRLKEIAEREAEAKAAAAPVGAPKKRRRKNAESAADAPESLPEATPGAESDAPVES
jgi:hypothetical protein